jgi:hypothetical protein
VHVLVRSADRGAELARALASVSALLRGSRPRRRCNPSLLLRVLLQGKGLRMLLVQMAPLIS